MMISLHNSNWGWPQNEPTTQILQLINNETYNLRRKKLSLSFKFSTKNTYEINI